MAIDYTRRDFNTIKDDLLRRATTVLPEWTDRDTSDFGMLFVDLWSYMGDVLHYYIDRANREAFLSTATRRESVLAFANLLDYTPSGRTAAIGTVTISNSSSTESFTLPAYSTLRGNTGSSVAYCYTVTDAVIPPSSTLVVTVYEGSIVTDSSFDGSLGISNGTASQRFSLSGTDVVSGSVRLFVYEDGVTKTEYRKVHSIGDGLYGERVFSTYTDSTGTTQVILGNNINGFIPPVNATLTVQFARSSGADGNYGTNVITTFRDTVSSTINIVSSSAFVGGSDEESIEALRTSIPIATRPQDRAVTLQDFVDTTLGVTGVYKATATYTSGSVTVYAVPIQSDYTLSTAASIPITATLKADVLAEITPRALLGVTPIVADYTTLTPINIAANVYVNERYVASWVISDVQAALNDLFSFDNINFGQRLTLSDVHRTIINVEGVDYAEIDPKTLGTFSSGVNTSSTSLTIGTGSKTFTVASSLDFVTGQTVVAYSTANYSNYMLGTVTSYTTTSLVINVTTVGGSGTGLTSWDIRSVSQALTASTTAGSIELFRKGDITLYSYGGITTSA